MVDKSNWKIIYYQASNQKNFPVYDFIESLDFKSQAKVSSSFDLLEKYGINLGIPHIKKLKSYDLWELRILGGDNIRIFYVAVKDRKFLLLHGFVKKKQKTDFKEIKIALNRLNDYLNRNK
jgi:phage-related protein